MYFVAKVKKYFKKTNVLESFVLSSLPAEAAFFATSARTFCPAKPLVGLDN